ncbi:MAG: 16S rRNA (cytosine(967)-C(5))-methyltransferase RsmB [Acidobacteriia bacterium]|nr:16S rRNA (cytosine(967)-C(5))-methyltransferase RsmB [Terriglobia bacterium]
MPISPARQAAFRILLRVESGRAFAVDLLQGREVARLAEVDRRLATELVMGTLRWRGELDYQLESLSGKPSRYFDLEVLTILRLGIYQIRFLEKIPQSAVVNEAVELTKAAGKRSAAGLVNAVLRKCQPAKARPRKIGAGEGDRGLLQAARRSFPAWILERWEQAYGREAADSLALAGVAVPLTTLRAVRGSREDAQQALAQEGVQAESGKYSGRALVVRSGNVLNSEAFRRGDVVIQDEASQLVVDLVAPQAGQRVLDVCAAPGIKAHQLAHALGEGTLVACDLSARRLQTMKSLLSGRIPAAVEFHVVRLDASRALPFSGQFERILVDVPCSGTGTLARNPEIKWRLKPADLPRLAELQRSILENVLRLLAPDGRLVYSTCSLEPEENEQVVESVLDENRDVRLMTAAELSRESPALAGLFDSRGYFRTRPDLHGMDGFFAAVIVRAGTKQANPTPPPDR